MRSGRPEGRTSSDVKLFIDECLSPRLALWLNDTGEHDAAHPLHVGRRGLPDHAVLAWCLDEDRTIVTENARDFRKLVGGADLHPGLIILPALSREETWQFLQAAIAFLAEHGAPSDVMVNHVLEVSDNGSMTLYELPPMR